MSWSWSPSFCKAVAQLALAATPFVTSACVSSRSFIPAEHVTAMSPSGGQYAAEYTIEENGSIVGDVKVWSGGAERDSSDGEPRTRVRAGFEIENHDASPLRLDTERLYLEEMAKAGTTPGRVGPASVTGDTLVPAGQTRQIDVVFALPSSVWPSDLPGYRVAWSVVGSRVHSRTTPFLRATEPPVDPWYPYYGYYYPGYYYYPGFYGSWSFRYRLAPGYRWAPGYPWAPPWRGRRYYYIP